MCATRADAGSPVSDDLAGDLRREVTEIAKLAGGLAHEIRNPLSTLNLNLQLLAEDFRHPATPREERALRKIDVLQGECVRLEKLLTDFLSFVRQTGLRLEAVSLNDVMKAVADLFGPQADRHGVVIRSSPAAGLPDCLIDPDNFKQAVVNLVVNALQAMPEGGDLILGTAREGDAVRLDITDTGGGMDAEALAGAFEPGFSTKPGGSGLGLPTARKIVRAHGGTLQVQSDPGQGTRFSIRLPAAQSTEEPS